MEVLLVNGAVEMESNAILGRPNRYPKLSNDLLKAAHQSGLHEMKLIILAASKLPQNADANDFDALAPIYITKDDALSIGFNAKNVARDLRTACSNLRSREIVIPTPFGDKVTGWIYNLLFFKTEIFRELKERYPDSRHDHEFIQQLRLHNLIDTLPFVMKSDENLMARVIMHPDVVPFLFQLKNNYTQIDLFELAKLTDSVYSLRIFLMMMQWKSSGKVYKQLDELRREFRLLDKYENTKDLRRRVIDMAVNEINEKTIYKVSYELKKTGRKYTHLELKFKPKQVKLEGDKRDPDTVDMFTGATDKELSSVPNPLSEKQAGRFAGTITAYCYKNNMTSEVHELGSKLGCHFNSWYDAKDHIFRELQHKEQYKKYLPILKLVGYSPIYNKG